MKRLPLLVVIVLLATGGTIVWVRVWPRAAPRSSADPIAEARREQAAALERDAESVRVLNAETRPPQAPPRALDQEQLSAEQKERIRAAHEKKEQARLEFEALLARQKAEREAAAGKPGPAAKEPSTTPKLALSIETASGAVHALRPLPLRIALANVSDAEVVLFNPLTPRMSTLSVSVRPPGMAWARVLLFNDTGGQPQLETRTSLAAGGRFAVHVEPTLPLGYLGGRFVPGRWGVCVEFAGGSEPRPAVAPSAELEVDVVEPQGTDRAQLEALIDGKRLGWLGARASVTAEEGKEVWRELAASARSQGMSPYAQDLRAGLLAQAQAGRSGFPSEERSARLRELVEGIERPTAWPRSERLLLQAWALEQLGEAEKAAGLRSAFEKLCPDDVRVAR